MGFVIVFSAIQPELPSRSAKMIMQALSDCVQKSLRGIINVRSIHVHVNRLTDENLDRLRTLELINHGPEKIPVMQTLYRSAYRDTRMKYGLTIKQNNKAIGIILDSYFDVIYKVVTNEKREIRYPKSKKA
jgi:hypothetical protein